MAKSKDFKGQPAATPQSDAAANAAPALTATPLTPGEVVDPATGQLIAVNLTGLDNAIVQTTTPAAGSDQPTILGEMDPELTKKAQEGTQGIPVVADVKKSGIAPFYQNVTEGTLRFGDLGKNGAVLGEAEVVDFTGTFGTEALEKSNEFRANIAKGRIQPLQKKEDGMSLGEVRHLARVNGGVVDGSYYRNALKRAQAKAKEENESE